MTHSVLESILITAVAASLPVLFAGLGELVSEKTGVMNVGVEGVMLMGAVIGVIIAVKTGSLPLALLAGGGVGAAFTLIFFGIPVLFLRTPQVLTGFGLWLIGVGLSDQMGQGYTTSVFEVGQARIHVPGLADIPVIGEILFDQTLIAYIGVAAVVAVAFMLARTRHGRNIRAIGENPASAHAAGISVTGWRAVYVMLGGGLMGIGGAILSVLIAQNWQSQMTSGRGFVAFALVIFVGWRPLGLIWASYVFGILLLLGGVGQAQGWSIPSEFLDMAPYLFTILVLVFRSWRELRSGAGTSAPSSLGLAFIRGQK